MNSSLAVLADPKNHDNLLLAEAVAWLHDMGKCDERLIWRSALDYDEKSNPIQYSYKKTHSHRVGTGHLELLGEESILLKTLIEESRPGISNDVNKHLLVRILGYCHSVAHTEKEEAYYLLEQTTTDTRRGNPFGYESEPLVDLETRLDKLPEQLSDHSTSFDRPTFKARVEKAFSYAVGDTRRPINEVTLWDWSSIVAALYKAALAAALLGYREDPPDMHWRLLSVRLNGAAFSERVARVPDLLVRQKLITDSLNRVCTLLEETYPLGTEVYRDENGSVFIVPHIKNLLALEDEQGERLSDLIIHEFSAGTIKNQTLQLGGEVIPSLKLDEGEPWTRPPKIFRYKRQDPLPINKHLEETPSSHADLHSMSSWWRSHSEDVCTVCQLRPQGWRVSGNEAHYDRRARGKKCPSNCQICKALERKVCGICEERREDRSKEWATKGLDTTIWIDEIADVNGRIALVVGKFDLEHWLDGQMLFYPDIRRGLFIESLKENVIVRKVEKLRDGHYRIVLDIILSGVADGDSCLIQGQNFLVTKVKGAEGSSEIKTASDGAVKVVEEQIIHPDRLEGEQHFKPLEMVSTQTPARLHRVWETTYKFWEEVKSNFRTSVGEVSPRLQIRASFVSESEANETLGDFHTYELKLGGVNLSAVYIKGGVFLTVDNLERVAVLLNSSEQMPQNYSAAVNYVRNRLQLENKLDRIFIEEPTGYGSPNKILGKLRLGEIILEQTTYTPAISILTEPRTFMAIVPADKALEVTKSIRRKYKKEMGKVCNRLPITVGVVFAGQRTPLPAILDAGRRMLKRPTQDECWTIEKVEPALPRSAWPNEVVLRLERDGQRLSVEAQTVMGDKTTRDVWFPYLRMKSPIPDKWAHICDLQGGDVVHLMPSHFDFEFLDTAARRFEVSYDDNGNRRGSSRPARPYYLEELDEFEKLWQILSNGLATSQVHNLISIIEAKRMEWSAEGDDKTFQIAVRDALSNAYWKVRPDQDDLKRLEQAALSGQLADIVELHMQILKDPVKVDEMGGNI